MPATTRSRLSPTSRDREARLLRRAAAKEENELHSAAVQKKNAGGRKVTAKAMRGPEFAFEIGKTVVADNGEVVTGCSAPGCKKPTYGPTSGFRSYEFGDVPEKFRVVPGWCGGGGCEHVVCTFSLGHMATHGLDKDELAAAASELKPEDSTPDLKVVAGLRSRMAAIEKAEKALDRARLSADAFVGARVEGGCTLSVVKHADGSPTPTFDETPAYTPCGDGALTPTYSYSPTGPSYSYSPTSPSYSPTTHEFATELSAALSAAAAHED